MPTRAHVLGMAQSGLSYDEIGRRLGISPGLAYMIATGLPADGGDTLSADERERPGFVAGSTQHLANHAKPQNPTQKQHVLDWIKQRAHSDAQMLRAAAARDADPGPVQAPDDRHDLVTVLTRDHNRVAALLEQLSTIPGHKKGGSPAQVERRASIVDMVTIELSRHEAAEEQYLWPTVRDVLDDGDAWAEQGRRQEQEGTETLAALAAAEPDSDRWDGLVEELVLRARQHVAFEERLFLALRPQLSNARCDELGAKIVTAKKAAPTRPHPRAPRGPAAAVKAAGAGAAAVDKLKDAAGDRPAKRRGKARGEREAKLAEARAAQEQPNDGEAG